MERESEADVSKTTSGLCRTMQENTGFTGAKGRGQDYKEG